MTQLQKLLGTGAEDKRALDYSYRSRWNIDQLVRYVQYTGTLPPDSLREYPEVTLDAAERRALKINTQEGK